MTEQLCLYNAATFFGAELMPKKKKNNEGQPASFGKRIGLLRQTVGLTQQELADEVGITRRMLAHYETAFDCQIAASLIPKFAEALGVTTDGLLGLEKMKEKMVPEGRLWKKLKQISKLPPNKRRQLTSVIDTFLETEKIKRAS